MAFVGDPRNDENLIINQMQQAFILLHNHFLDNDAHGDFVAAQQLTRWHYQWMIVHDYLPHVVGQPLVDDMVFNTGSRIRARIMFYRPGSLLRPMIAIEYSAGAYRWGHSGIRPEYEMHESPGLSPNPAVLPIFNGDPDPVHARDLRGSRPLYPDATIDWNYFFQIPGVDAPDDRNFARLIDTQVARPLHDLPDRWSPMCRERSSRWPSATCCAASGSALGGGRQLGPVTGRVVAEVILGLLQTDSHLYWNAGTPRSVAPTSRSTSPQACQGPDHRSAHQPAAP